MPRPHTQIPGRRYTFYNHRSSQKDSGILPVKHGLSNDFAIWNGKKNYVAGGFWASRKFRLQNAIDWNDGTGKQGLITRMRRILTQAKTHAKNGGYVATNSTPENLLKQWKSQKGKCVACRSKMKLKEAIYDHNHETGEPRGFIHPICNLVEGFFKRHSGRNRRFYLRWLFKIGTI
jgi:hypothetical protein